tara:strand:- start:99 stop:722 length:624 start_codon:yes stop_codon:yes gene_type:complete
MKVAWIHESDETNPPDAAVEAATLMQRPDTSRYFKVRSADGEMWSVDLNQPEIRQVTYLGKENDVTVIKHNLKIPGTASTVEVTVALGESGLNLNIEGYENPDGGPVVTLSMKDHPLLIIHRSVNRIEGSIQTEQLDLRACHVDNKAQAYDFVSRMQELQEMEPAKLDETAAALTGRDSKAFRDYPRQELINLILATEREKHEGAQR